MLLNRGIIDIQLRGGRWIRRQPPWKRSSVAHSSERGWARPATQGHNGDRAVKRQKGWEGNTGKKPQCGFHGKEEQVRLCEQQWAEGKPLCLWVSEFSICKIPQSGNGARDSPRRPAAPPSIIPDTGQAMRRHLGRRERMGAHNLDPAPPALSTWRSTIEPEAHRCDSRLSVGDHGHRPASSDASRGRSRVSCWTRGNVRRADGEKSAGTVISPREPLGGNVRGCSFSLRLCHLVPDFVLWFKTTFSPD